MSGEQRYPRFNRNLYLAVQQVIKALVRLFFRLHVEGIERFSKEGPCILVSNHLSYFDPPVLFAVVPTTMYLLAAEKYEFHPVFGPLLRVGGAIFIQRGEIDRKALRQVLAVLEDGHQLGMAAEGTRSRTGGLGPGKLGTAYLATRSGAPVVPVVVWGTEQVLRSWLRLRRPDVYVRFGAPIQWPQKNVRTEELEQYTEELMCTLAAMLPPSYRGVYAEHPLIREKLVAQESR